MKMPGAAINQLLTKTHEEWQYIFDSHNGRSPLHLVVSQLVAILGSTADDVRFIDMTLPDALNPDDLTLDLLVFTDELLLNTTLDAGGTPQTRIIDRKTLTGLLILEAPTATTTNPGARWQPFRMQLEYPERTVQLPFRERDRSRVDAAQTLLPSIIEDLKRVTK